MNTEIKYQSHIDLDLTNSILDIKGPCWLPYIGVDYHQASNKILVIGLSHYDVGNSDSWSSILQSVNPNIVSTVENGLCYSNRNEDYSETNKSKFHRGLERIFFNNTQRDLYKSDFIGKREKFWSQIAFTQLIEKPMIGNSKHDGAIEKEEIRNGALENIKNLIELLKPDHVLMMSNKYLYHQKLEELPEIHSQSAPVYVNLIPEKSDIRNCFFKIGDHNFTYSALYHPSRYRYVAKQHELLNMLMPNFLKTLNE